MEQVLHPARPYNDAEMNSGPPQPLAMAVEESMPTAQLRPYVSSFHFSDMELGESRLHMPILAGSETMLQFSIGDPFTIRNNDSGALSFAPPTVVVGRQTRRNFDLVATGRLTILTVHFQPTGFHRLFHLPMTHLTDQAPEATAVVGREIRMVQDAVASAPGRSEMVARVEAFLQSRVDTSLPQHPVANAAACLLRGAGASDIRGIAGENALSTRQLERRFLEQIGVSPRAFRRIARFERALQSKHREPARSWADIASDSGYFDQMHLVRDCHQLGGGAPSDLIRERIDCEPPRRRPAPTGAPERQVREMSLTY
ncbi:MAG: hypothetical protein NVS3B24_01720 [Candidatus Dormibacteria bacterium]